MLAECEAAVMGHHDPEVGAGGRRWLARHRVALLAICWLLANDRIHLVVAAPDGTTPFSFSFTKIGEKDITLKSGGGRFIIVIQVGQFELLT